MNVLIINAGSSSLKYQLMDPQTEAVLAKGICERIGVTGELTHKVPGKDDYKAQTPMPTHNEAIAVAIAALLNPDHGVISDVSEIDAVGHRIVHGGESFSKSVIIDDDVIEAIEQCVPLAPLHNPANLTGIRACTEVIGKDVPQVAVFDTAFHQTMPPKSYIYALPYKYYEKYKIRRYGFHGTSHKYVAQRAAAMLKRPLEELKLVSCHLGNGSSICAIKHGKSVDTSMGFTPLSGLPMGTRSGDIDPGILGYVMDKDRENLSIDEMIDVLNKESGVLGISGISSDFRDVSEAVIAGDERAKLALGAFNYNVQKLIGSYVFAMDGVDAIIFTAGIGENDDILRGDVCEGLGFLGAKLDPEKNFPRGPERFICTDDSPVKLLVIPTNEELMIAKDTMELVGLK